MNNKEKILKQINELRVPYDMRKMAWDWYVFGYEDGQNDANATDSVMESEDGD